AVCNRPVWPSPTPSSSTATIGAAASATCSDDWAARLDQARRLKVGGKCVAAADMICFPERSIGRHCLAARRSNPPASRQGTSRYLRTVLTKLLDPVANELHEDRISVSCCDGCTNARTDCRDLAWECPQRSRLASG